MAILLKREIQSTRQLDRGSLPEKIWLKQQFSIGVNDVLLVASDCNPRWLTKHLPSLAPSRKLPVIFVKDGKEGSLRLGELAKLKTAKAEQNNINKLFDVILHGNGINFYLAGRIQLGYLIERQTCNHRSRQVFLGWA
ncbi:hypothetical protein L6164_034857 [Bauhinia variegata]|uniref:Uncharacterized protein n=1 Tax=Bauhinia variegata TaxID=167791 RepID=A0ACB9KWJ2_BAUVA|nr:hypothetical protein L6164_034857 [Bauhinia variegata]